MREFLGKPMLAWPIEALRSSELFDQIIVSSEDSEILDLAHEFGAATSVRDQNLSDDLTHASEVLREWLASDESTVSEDQWVYLVYPTAPVTPSLISDFVDFAEREESFALTIAPFTLAIQRALQMGEGSWVTFREPKFANTRTQDLETFFFDCGKIYGATKKTWSHGWHPLQFSGRGYIVPDWLAFDLDHEEDWLVAESKVRIESSGEKIDK